MSWLSADKPSPKTQIEENALKCGFQDGDSVCQRDAEFILWYPMTRGPRCDKHAIQEVGYDALREGANTPIYHLPRVGAVGDYASGGLMINGQDVGMNGVQRQILDPLAEEIAAALVSDQPYTKR